MNKMSKLLLCFGVIALMIFVPLKNGVDGPPGPDDRPIGWIYSVEPEETNDGGSQVQSVFDKILEKFPGLENYLPSNISVLDGPPGPDDRPIGWQINSFEILEDGYNDGDVSIMGGPPGPDDRPIGWR